MKKLFAILTALVLATSLAACGGSDSSISTEGQSSSAGTTVGASHKIGFACDDLSTDFAAAMADGVKNKCAELGIEVEITDANKDPNNQTSQVENMITNGCEAIIMSPYDLSACGALATACEEAGIPLIVLNTPLNDGTYFSTAVVMDIEAMATAKANAIVEALDGEGRVYMLMGPLAQEMWTTQADIARKIFAEHPGIEIIDEQTGNNKRDESIVVMENWISTGAEFDAVWCSNDASAIGAGTACKEAGLDAFIIGQGGQAEGCQAIKDGLFDWTIYAPGSLIGSSGVEAAYKLLSGEEVGKTYSLKLEYVTPENVDEYL
ncbi:sugar ABC transporter substrate-binding protein [Anaerofilum sp. BX8]|uniref:Sugar ABC transporter substrate-binding protein n=1 Tax=Anaerofilum hominis TaxID=2763016 RepID=A0A923L192_9FIRM|nr:sugar ABC transporter substrate-binding protein [Anaerofilum hominis]MBC5581870.1 sugar ABC transporter substrate-binding protein [Anaerofilum hominis]